MSISSSEDGDVLNILRSHDTTTTKTKISSIHVNSRAAVAMVERRLETRNNSKSCNVTCLWQKCVSHRIQAAYSLLIYMPEWEVQTRRNSLLTDLARLTKFSVSFSNNPETVGCKGGRLRKVCFFFTAQRYIFWVSGAKAVKPLLTAI